MGCEKRRSRGRLIEKKKEKEEKKRKRERKKRKEKPCHVVSFRESREQKKSTRHICSNANSQSTIQKMATMYDEVSANLCPRVASNEGYLVRRLYYRDSIWQLVKARKLHNQGFHVSSQIQNDNKVLVYAEYFSRMKTSSTRCITGLDPLYHAGASTSHVQCAGQRDIHG